MLHNNLHILLISETEIDSSFPTAQFQIEGYKTYRLDKNANGGGILLYIQGILLYICLLNVFLLRQI